MFLTMYILVLFPVLTLTQFAPKFISMNNETSLSSITYVNTKNNNSTSMSLSRKKRFLVFPSNSVMTLSSCLAKGGLILSPPAFVFTFDWDLAFALPDNTDVLNRVYPPLRTIHMQRRELGHVFATMENLIQRLGFDGRACVLRAVCEAQQMLAPGKFGLMEDIFHALFTLPQDTLKSEDDDLRDHDIAHRHGRSNQDCEALYSSCPVSLLNLALW